MNAVPETVDIRSSQGGGLLRPFFDWLSGVPLSAVKPRLFRPPAVQVIDSVGGFVVFLVAASIALPAGHPMLAAASVFVAAGRARKSYITIEHQVIHNELFRIKNRKVRRMLNRVIGETIGTVLWVPEPAAYHRTHAGSHHSIRDLATPRDLDGAWVFRAGFLPGKPVRYYWRLLVSVLLDPRFYVGNAVDRVRMSLFTSTRNRRIQSWLFLFLLAVGTVATDAYALLAMYTTAMFVLFPLAGVLQTLGKHFWGCHMDKVGTKARTGLVCQGRFLFDRFPAGLAGRAWWAVRCLGYHLPAKILVLSGDVQMHDFHHRRPNTKDWCIAAWGRQADSIAGCPGWEDVVPYQQSWSLFGSIQRTFQEMAAAPKFTDEWMAIVNGNGRALGEL